MKFKLLSLLCVVSLAIGVSCSSGASGDASVSTTFKIDSIVSAGSTNNIESDMLSPEGITADYATITVSNLLKNPNATPSYLNNVTIYKYEVSFRRSDGGTVFETFEKNLSQTVQVNGTQSFSALIVRLEEKTSGALAGQSLPIQMEADIKIYARTGSGDETVTTGGIAVTIADYNGEAAPAADISAFYAVNSVIEAGDTVTLAWYVSGSVYDLVLNPGDIHLNVNDYYPYGTYDIPNITPPQTFTLHAIGTSGSASLTTNVTLKEADPASIPAINYFGSNPDTIATGDNSTLQWDVVGADSVKIYPGVGSVALGTGTATVSPLIDTTYTIVASNSEGTSTATTDVTVTSTASSDPVIGLFVASASEVSFNDVVHLYWNVYGNYNKIELFPYYDGANDILDVTSMTSVVSKAITHDTTFVLSAFGPSTIVNKSVSVTVATTKNPLTTIKSYSKIESKVVYDVEKNIDSKVDYTMFNAFGDNLNIENSKGVLTESKKIESNINRMTDMFGFSVLGISFTDNKGNIDTDYRFIADKIDNGLIENIFSSSNGNSNTLSIELSKETSLFVKQISGEGRLQLNVNGQTVDGAKGLMLNNVDMYSKINFKGDLTNARLLIVAKDINGFVNGRIVNIGK